MDVEDLIEYVDDAVRWMIAAKHEYHRLLLPAWVSQWRENRPTPRAADGLESEPKCYCPADGLYPGCPVHGNHRR